MPIDKKTTQDLVKYRLEVAKSALEEAQILFNADKYKGSNNRAYYSIFYSTLAVEAMDGKEFRKHKDAIASFNKDYVKTYIFPRDPGKRISDAQELRHESDYEAFYLASRNETEEQIQTAEELLGLANEYCRKREYGLKGKEEV